MEMKKLFEEKNHLIAAHRGNRSVKPENTMDAFISAVNKCDFIELDVCCTKDAEVVVIHDDTLDRTSDVKKHKKFKKPYRVADYTYNEIMQLDFSSWFYEQNPFKTLKKHQITDNLKPQRISKLSEVLEFSKKYKMPLNIEIKEMKNTSFEQIAVKKIANLIQEYQIAESLLISSFNHFYLKDIKKYIPDILTAALVEKNHPSNLVSYLKELDVFAYHPCVDIINKDIIKKLNKYNFYVNVYTVNSKNIRDKLFSEGVKAIFTDYLKNMSE
jgi:glycerophosphoryl diester phosphodiesterase